MMVTRVFVCIIFIVLGVAATAAAELDLDQEVLIIPDTHNEKPYIRHVRRNPRGYELALSDSPLKAGEEQPYIFRILSPSGMPEGDVHVFITDDDLHAYVHRKASRKGDEYSFTYRPPGAGKYRMEIVFQTAQGWVNLWKNIKISGPAAAGAEDKLPGDEDYQAKIKLIPKKAYAEHVVTFLYEILYKGKPLKGLEKMDGFDMLVASWDEDLKEFLYITPKQNLGGPEVAVSIVFMRPGKHAVFAEFKHNGVIRRIDTVVFVNEEPRSDPGAIENMGPGY
ncbi:MAG: hypothetical protein M0Z79_07105 [Nitrospiraceae bacterium]|nr:hypothetical protein [Nitrospiraceae bacterium]